MDNTRRQVFGNLMILLFTYISGFFSGWFWHANDRPASVPEQKDKKPPFDPDGQITLLPRLHLEMLSDVITDVPDPEDPSNKVTVVGCSHVLLRMRGLPLKADGTKAYLLIHYHMWDYTSAKVVRRVLDLIRERYDLQADEQQMLDGFSRAIKMPETYRTEVDTQLLDRCASQHFAMIKRLGQASLAPSPRS